MSFGTNTSFVPASDLVSISTRSSFAFMSSSAAFYTPPTRGKAIYRCKLEQYWNRNTMHLIAAGVLGPVSHSVYYHPGGKLLRLIFKWVLGRNISPGRCCPWTEACTPQSMFSSHQQATHFVLLCWARGMECCSKAEYCSAVCGINPAWYRSILCHCLIRIIKVNSSFSVHKLLLALCVKSDRLPGH